MGPSSQRSARAWAGWILFGILLIAAPLRMWRLTAASFWLDEFFTDEVASGRGYWMWDIPRNHVLHAESANAGIVGALPNSTGMQQGFGQVTDALVRSNHPPLYFLLMHGWMRFFGESDRALRMFSVAMSVLAIGFLFDAMRWLQGSTTALYAAATMALAGPQINLAQEARGYTLLIAMMLAACAAAARIERLGLNKRRGAALFFACLATVLTHYLGIPLIGGLLIYVLWRLKGFERRAATILVTFAVLVAGALWGPFAWEQHDPAIWRLPWSSAQIPQIAFLPWLKIFASLPVQCFFTPVKSSIPIAAVGAIVYIIPLTLLKRRADLSLWWLLMVVSAGTLACVDLIHHTATINVVRYTLPLTVSVYATVIGVCSSLNRGKNLAMLTPIIACLLTLNQAYISDKPDARALSAYVVNCSHRGDALAFFHSSDFAWGDQALFMSISHYERNFAGPVLFLDAPNDGNLLNQMQPMGVVLLNQSPAASTSILPDRQVRNTSSFPALTLCVDFTPKRSSAELAITDTTEKTIEPPKVPLGKIAIPLQPAAHGVLPPPVDLFSSVALHHFP